MDISDQELCALYNLADKQAGETVEFISITAARALTELGLARRTRSGWEITTEGAALIKDQKALGRLTQASDPIPFHADPNNDPN